MSEDVAEARRQLTKEFVAIESAGKSVGELDITRLTDENKKEIINGLYTLYDKYLKCYEENVPKLIEPLRPVYARQKSLAVNICRCAVEILGFVFETDFLFAFNLENDTPEVHSGGNPFFPENTENQNLHNSEIVNNQDNSGQNNINRELEMANFDLKTATTLIPDFDGDCKNVSDFLDKCEFYNDTLTENGKATFLNFLLKVKIASKVKDKFNTGVIPANFDAFKTRIIDRFSDKTTKEAKINKIENLRQTDSVANFATKLETLSSELVKLKMIGKDVGALDIIKSEVEELAIRVFIKGLKRDVVKQALIYKEPDTLDKAIKFALEADAKFFTPDNSNVNAYGTQNTRNFDNRNNQNNNYNQRYSQNRNQNYNSRQFFRNSQNYNQFQNNNMRNDNQSYQNRNVNNNDNRLNSNYNNNRNNDNYNNQNNNYSNRYSNDNNNRNNNYNNRQNYNNSGRQNYNRFDNRNDNRNSNENNNQNQRWNYNQNYQRRNYQPAQVRNIDMQGNEQGPQDVNQEISQLGALQE